ncbi:alpha/beta hydrolase [Microbacterium sp. SORGH_AS_0888]|uniref:alpha/beta hydrolase n=1 Tax=Microbacterium sp. SORGH_AS_0888 TaxID=3041791 RepID=UPI002780A8A9|nr:alpha/beta hydrolase [Microbacterium sp. SORGH_AS_0888]MDQ1130982.1 pimeloyl-ACP methyl ester carboxylesterase [Microbacterium sp. SORGH_AS_0888]
MTRRLPRLLAVVAGLAAASVTLSGCLFSPIPDERTTSSPAPTDGLSADVLPYYTQTVQWSACGSFQCAKVTAPLDWHAPSAGRIELAVIRQTALDGHPQGSLLVNPGGPGASAVSFLRDSLSTAVGSELPKTYDVVAFDPRGVGASTAVTCLDAAGMDAHLFDIPPGTRGSDEWNAAVGAGNASFAQACEAHSGGILPYISTEQSARDMDLIRGVLGDEKLTYLGYSYGTKLGAIYAELFPARVGRLVLDGAMDPSIGELGVSTAQAIGFESSMRAYMASCLAGTDCPFTGTVDDGMADLGTMLARVDQSPLANSDGRMLGADTLLTAIVAALYSQSSWSYLTTALTNVDAGNPATAFQLADFYYNRSNGTYSDNSTEAFTAYNCMDYARTSTAADVDAANRTLREKAPTVAPYWGSDTVAHPELDPCSFWPVPATGTAEPVSAPGAAPIVVIGTTGDPATPYDWAVSLAHQLSSGVLITRVGEGHTGFNKGNSCVDDAVETYFRDGTPPNGDLRCE